MLLFITCFFHLITEHFYVPLNTHLWLLFRVSPASGRGCLPCLAPSPGHSAVKSTDVGKSNELPLLPAARFLLILCDSCHVGPGLSTLAGAPPEARALPGNHQSAPYSSLIPDMLSAKPTPDTGTTDHQKMEPGSSHRRLLQPLRVRNEEQAQRGEVTAHTGPRSGRQGEDSGLCVPLVKASLFLPPPAG